MARGATRANSKAAGKSRRKVDVPDVYRDMLADTVSSFPTRTSADGRAVKRRRVGGRVVIQANDSPQSTPESKATNEDNIDDLFNEPKPGRQRIEQTESEDSTESDVDWEEINLKDSGTQGAAVERDFEESGELNLVLGGDERRTSKSAQVRLKPVTAAEKKLRLEIHKMHLCSLLVHVYIRNHWCNDESVHVSFQTSL